MDLVLDFAAQPLHCAVDDDIEQEGLQPAEYRRADIEQQYQHQHPADRAEIHTDTRGDIHRAEHVGEGVVARGPQPLDRLFLGDATRQLAADHTVENHIGGLTENVWPERIQHHRDDRERDDHTDVYALGRQPAQEPAQRRTERFRLRIRRTGIHRSGSHRISSRRVR